MSREVEVSIHFLELILGYQDAPAEALYDLFEIKNGNKKVILEHLKTINKITMKAIKDLEGDKNDKTSSES